MSGHADGVAQGAEINDLGWEIYPQGIAEVCQKLYDITPLPLYITENGTCDNADTFRSRYLYEHLKVLSECGLPVQRYYHWCFCDNFEWLEGQSARFGLVHIDYDTQQRTVMESGRFYAEMIRQGGDELPGGGPSPRNLRQIGEEATQLPAIAPLPQGLQHQAQGPLHRAGTALMELRHRGIEPPCQGVEIAPILHDQQDGVPQVQIALEVGRRAQTPQLFL